MRLPRDSCIDVGLYTGSHDDRELDLNEPRAEGRAFTAAAAAATVIANIVTNFNRRSTRSSAVAAKPRDDRYYLEMSFRSALKATKLCCVDLE